MSFLTGFSATSPETVLSQFPLCRTTNIDEAVSWCERVFCESEIRSSGVDDKIDATIFYRKLGCAGIGRMSYGANVTITPRTFESFLLVQMPIRGEEQVEFDGHRWACTPTQGLVLNAHAQTRIYHDAGTEKLFARIDSELLNTCCQQALGRSLRKPIEFQPIMPLHEPGSQQWMRTLGWLFDALSTDMTELPPLMRTQMERTLAVTLLIHQPNNYSAELRAGDERSITPAFVRRAERFVEEHAQDAITIGDIAAHVGVSTRSLYAGFRRYRNTSPMQHLKDVRLRRVFEELKVMSPTKGTIASVAFNWGFNHLGHFSADYKRLFNETPSQTLAR
ncbi:AraC family transcriptional regulator [Burkholderia sp. Bp9015]|uniref:AraC family transcriptional regulator n=1 Tax=Burkholderia sp. Bp9015 TaxID=2184563 RepID=UPI000F58F89E|nr:AraC family transcriptional regulator [Burkholderia sp. Bp9015]RQR74788.1 AraC family transcriptional regulator [Burkholderia sp. Bp9015]